MEAKLTRYNNSLPLEKRFELDSQNRISALQAYKLLCGQSFQKDIFVQDLDDLQGNKSKMSTPAGGQRPDGRIDSSPENLRDTTRTQNVAGEAVVPAGKKPQTNATDEVSINTEINRLKNLDAKSFDKGYYEHALVNHKQLTALLEEAGNFRFTN